MSAIERKTRHGGFIGGRIDPSEQGSDAPDAAPWFSSINLPLPFWRDYRQLITRLKGITGNGPELPSFRELQRLLPADAVNHRGNAIILVASTSVPGVEYERHIFRTAQVSTRENNWHDVFNALVWARFPHLKSAMNALHYGQIGLQKDGRRSRLRDALTLLDECGVIIASANPDLLRELAARNWRSAFCRRAAVWRQEIRIFVCGHALLEKFLNPYKSLTAHAVLACLDTPVANEPGELMLQAIDLHLSEALLEGGCLHSPADLSPVPLMGIPGWWQQGAQDEAFYADRDVFRLPAKGFCPAPLFDLNLAEAYHAIP